MLGSASILDDFRDNVVNRLHDVVDLTTKGTLNKLHELDVLKAQLAELRGKIQTSHQQLTAPISTEVTYASLNAHQESRASNAHRCLAMCARMTSCAVDSSSKLTCGSIQLRQGDSVTELQANWDLIDTVTGADA
jgi:hypothetical protein